MHDWRNFDSRENGHGREECNHASRVFAATGNVDSYVLGLSMPSASVVYSLNLCLRFMPIKGGVRWTINIFFFKCYHLRDDENHTGIPTADVLLTLRVNRRGGSDNVGQWYIVHCHDLDFAVILDFPDVNFITVVGSHWVYMRFAGDGVCRAITTVRDVVLTHKPIETRYQMWWEVRIRVDRSCKETEVPDFYMMM